MAASLAKAKSLVSSRFLALSRPLVTSNRLTTKLVEESDQVTHTGQRFEDGDYRKVRFTENKKLVTQKWAIDMVAADPVVVCEKRVVFSDSKGPLGHPRVYINLDPPEVHVCGYSGRKFILKKYYNEGQHGPSITYDEYLKEMDSQPKDYPA